MGNLVVDAAQKQVADDVQKVQQAIDGAFLTNHKTILTKRAIASVETLKSALKSTLPIK